MNINNSDVFYMNINSSAIFYMNINSSAIFYIDITVVFYSHWMLSSMRLLMLGGTLLEAMQR